MVVPAGSAAAVVLAYLWAQTRALREQERLVRLDGEDAVHQMRVAARRLRSALRTFRRVLDRDRTCAVVEELRWLAGELAPARDCEVMHARLTELVEELPAGLVPADFAPELDAIFTRRAAAARTRALAAVDSARYRALLDALDALVLDPPIRPRGLRAARRVLPREVARAHRRVVTAMAVTLERPPGADRDAALHEARKAAKRLRYADEAARAGLGRPPRGWKRRIEAVQDLLGAHQDSVVTRATVLALARDDALDGFVLGELYGHEALRGRQVEEALPAAWARVPGPG